MSRYSSFNKNVHPSQKKNRGLLHKLSLLQIRGSLQPQDHAQRLKLFHPLPRRLAFHLRDLVSRDILESGHVFLGFTKDSQFVLSYSFKLEWVTGLDYPCYKYRLQWWRFVPFSPLIKVSKVMLFGGYEINRDLNIAVCEWPNDGSKILIIGCCYSPSQDAVQCYMTITSYPSLIPCPNCRNVKNERDTEDEESTESESDSEDEPVREKGCLEHSFIIHTNYQVVRPFPPFNPAVSMKRDGMVVINTGDNIHVLQVSIKKEDTQSKSSEVLDVADRIAEPRLLLDPSVSQICLSSENSQKTCVSSNNSALQSLGIHCCCCWQQDGDWPTNAAGMGNQAGAGFPGLCLEASPTGSTHLHKNSPTSKKMCHLCCDVCVRVNNKSIGAAVKKGTDGGKHDSSTANKPDPSIYIIHRLGDKLCVCQDLTLSETKANHSSLDDPALISSSAVVVPDGMKGPCHKSRVSSDVISGPFHIKSAMGQESKSPHLPGFDKASTSKVLGLNKVGDHVVLQADSSNTHDLYNVCQTPTNRLDKSHCDKREDKGELHMQQGFGRSHSADNYHLSQINGDSMSHRIHCPHAHCLKCGGVPSLVDKFPSRRPGLLLERTFLCPEEEEESLKENISPCEVRSVSNVTLNSDALKAHELSKNDAFQEHCTFLREHNRDSLELPLREAYFHSEFDSFPQAQSSTSVKNMFCYFTEEGDGREGPFSILAAGIGNEDIHFLDEYQNSFPFEVHGTRNHAMKACKDRSGKMKEAAVLIQQLTFDLEPYVQDMAEKLCLEAGQKYLCFNDYDVQLIDLCPTSGSLLVLVHMLVQVTVPKSGKGKLTKTHERQVFQAGFTFEWNINAGTYQVIDTRELEELDPCDRVHERYSHQWNPARRAALDLQKQFNLPLPYSRSINVLTNSAVFKGVSLDVLWAPSRHVAIML